FFVPHWLPLKHRGITNPHLGRTRLEASRIRQVRTRNGMLAELPEQASQQRVRSRQAPLRQSLAIDPCPLGVLARSRRLLTRRLCGFGPPLQPHHFVIALHECAPPIAGKLVYEARVLRL